MTSLYEYQNNQQKYQIMKQQIMLHQCKDLIDTYHKKYDLHIKTINKLDKELLNKNKEINEIKEEINKERENYTCQICYDVPRDTILFPCRHFFCYSCSNKFTQCPNCREEIFEKVKVYF
jgi:hypothetical protein